MHYNLQARERPRHPRAAPSRSREVKRRNLAPAANLPAKLPNSNWPSVDGQVIDSELQSRLQSRRHTDQMRCAYRTHANGRSQVFPSAKRSNCSRGAYRRPFQSFALKTSATVTPARGALWDARPRRSARVTVASPGWSKWSRSRSFHSRLPCHRSGTFSTFSPVHKPSVTPRRSGDSSS